MIAQAADEVVPVSREPHHHERLKNDYLRAIEIIVDAGDTTLFHKHELDFAFCVIQGGEIKNETPNNPEAQILHAESGSTGFSAYQAKPYVHRITNLSPQSFRVIAFETTPYGR